MLLQTNKAAKSIGSTPAQSDSEAREALNERSFMRMLGVERKRTERSGDPFLLMLLDVDKRQGMESEKVLEQIVGALSLSIRESDIIGWYRDHRTVGVLFIGLAKNERKSLESIILNKVSATLQDRLPRDEFNRVSISIHFFPDDWDHDKIGRPSNPVLYPDLARPEPKVVSLLGIKLVIDIIGSAVTLLLCSPLFVLIALAIKASSKGPVFFRQQRIGQYGRYFTFLKFRSMYIDNDHLVHQAYVSKLIAGGIEHPNSSADSKGVYKLTNDTRITRVGRLLRRTSLDELPQLINVLKGEMSLVGPRPAIPYELAMYQTWHRRRMLEVKPGITGLWQVSGRSRVKFDEMVRLDIRYAKSWSLWLDLVILIRTPLAVIGGAGAC
jgi:lipopolysaccharide/colanic/teichoic acid biosynthesis glycosyltransferase